MPPKVSSEQVLFESNYVRVFRTVYLYCGSYELTEDAVQEAFAVAFQKLHQLRKKESFAAWVTSIAVNVIRHNHMKKKKAKLVSIESVKEIACSSNDFNMVELKDEVQHLLNSLDDVHREALLLHYMFSLTLDEISHIQKVSQGTIKSRMSRAKEKIRRFYKEVVTTDE